LIVFITIVAVCLNNVKLPAKAEELKQEQVEEVEGEIAEVLEIESEWDTFIRAVIWKESKGVENCIGDNGKAVGVLQIHPIMVREANRILAMKDESKANYYTYDDRYSREKSIEMFKIVQDYHNKSHDFRKALDIWNHGHPDSYRNDIFNKYKELRI
jgi:hypothetical protein